MKSIKLIVPTIAILLMIGYVSAELNDSKTLSSQTPALEILEKQIEDIRSDVASVLPPKADVKVAVEPIVSVKPGVFFKPDLRISLHVLEGRSPDDKSPYVQEDYNSQEKITRLARYRCVRILKKIATGYKIPDVSSIIIEVKHGVRKALTIDGVIVSKGNDAEVIYAFSISPDDIRASGLSNMDEEKIIQKLMVGNENEHVNKLDFRSKEK